MEIPTYDQFVGPLLYFLNRQNGPVPTTAAYEAVAEIFGMSEADKSELIPSQTQPIYKNRIGWAHDALKRNGLSASPRRGYWELTEEGKHLALKYPSGLPEEEARRIANRNRNTPLVQLFGKGSQLETELVELGQKSPEEKIDEGLREIRESIATEILEMIGRSSPSFFEALVLDLLHAMGYGANRSALQQVGGSGDGGIDGIISLDRLGLEKVYVQAKRWKGQVGSPEIQGFMGALQLNAANKGVFITSGSVSGPAWEAAKRARGNIVIVDGERLAQLMIEHEVGVSSRVLKVPRVDSDYFESE